MKNPVIVLIHGNVLLAIGIVALAVILLVALFAPMLVTHSPVAASLGERLHAPSWDHFAGTDQFGRDIYSRIVMGAQSSLTVALLSTAVALAGGVLLGTLAGWRSGWVDGAVMRVMDVVLAFPSVVLAVALAAMLGAGVDKLVIILGFSRIPEFARVVRSSVITVKNLDYVAAAKVLGYPGPTIVWRHVLPNCITPLIVFASFSAATAVNAEAALSFLGLGIQAPHPSWGTMLSDARQYMFQSPGLAIFPGAAITVTVLAFNLVGDGLRDALDPRLH